MLQALDDVTHFVSAHWLNSSVQVTKELHLLPDLFVMRPERNISLIRAEQVLKISGHSCGLTSGIEYNSISSLEG